MTSPRRSFFFLMLPPPPRSTLFPYTTLFRSDLDRQLDRLRARIVEEHGIGKAVGDEPFGELLLAGDLEQIRAVPQLLRLRGHRLDQMRMAVAKRGDGDAAGEVEEFAAVASIEIATLAPFAGDVPRAM